MEISLLLGCFYLARGVEMISTPVASELISLTVRTRHCRVPTPINCRDTAVPCPLYHSDATANDMTNS